MGILGWNIRQDALKNLIGNITIFGFVALK